MDERPKQKSEEEIFRIPGRDRGLIRIADDFDELPEELLAEFEGNEADSLPSGELS